MSIELTEQEIKAFKAKLDERFVALRREISAELISHDEERYSDLAGRVHDEGDEALADLLVDLELASIDRHVQEIRDIDAALMRIATGNYGECCDCQEAIAIKRLEASPAAKRCVICQEAYDRTHAHAGQPRL